MIRHWFIILTLLLAKSAQAQQAAAAQEGASAQTNLNALTTGTPTMVPRGASESVVGSPYADNRWLLANIQTTNNVPLAPVPLKYDVLNNRLLMLNAHRHNDSLQLNDQLISGFTLLQPSEAGQPARQRTFRRFREAPNAEQRQEYVEVLHEGRYTLLKRYVKVLQKADYQGAYSTGQRYDQIENKPVYFLRQPNGVLVQVRLTSKAIQAAAPDLAAALKSAFGAKTDTEWAAVLDSVDKK